ncbi:unnamed protein product [Taenia asiatica]|uniref:Malate dehydrogenase, mitochondrial n=1 Tax=Taenia asiatica TaxID=60517 RepID=A0A0R3VZZ6_TAEAS|nr:unnamed protein product [Taenia asiatica]
MNCLRRVAVVSQRSAKLFSTSAQNPQKIAILGACGGIGQPLALLMKQSLFVSDIALYDVANTAGVAADLSHIETRAKVTGHTGPDNLKMALEGTKLVLIPAGVPRKPGVFRPSRLLSFHARVLVFWCFHCSLDAMDGGLLVV